MKETSFHSTILFISILSIEIGILGCFVAFNFSITKLYKFFYRFLYILSKFFVIYIFHNVPFSSFNQDFATNFSPKTS